MYTFHRNYRSCLLHGQSLYITCHIHVLYGKMLTVYTDTFPNHNDAWQCTSFHASQSEVLLGQLDGNEINYVMKYATIMFVKAGTQYFSNSLGIH